MNKLPEKMYITVSMIRHNHRIIVNLKHYQVKHLFAMKIKEYCTAYENVNHGEVMKCYGGSIKESDKKMLEWLHRDSDQLKIRR